MNGDYNWRWSGGRNLMNYGSKRVIVILNFFHASTTAKRRKNMLVALKNDAGEWMETGQEIGDYL